jgi:hypothetical protein
MRNEKRARGKGLEQHGKIKGSPARKRSNLYLRCKLVEAR